MDVEFEEWEMLQSNQASDTKPLTPGENTSGVDEVGGGQIQPNYFCIDSSQIRYMNGSEEKEDSEQSDNPSWIDPSSSENQFTIKTSGEFWLDSGSERSEGRIIGDEFEGNSEGIQEIPSESENNRFGASPEDVSVQGNLQENGNVEGEKKIEVVEHRNAKRSIVWWKVPIQLIKYCAFRVSSPVWTFSVAAAVMAFLVLGRRLYNMKKKTKAALQLKVTVDDKNISQFTSRAARLNEAFSIVKRVPVFRPQLPAAGVTLWPVMR